MKKAISKIWFVAMCAIAVVACEDDEKPHFSVQIKEDVNLGKILTDKNGFTLYFFSYDTKGTSTCSGSCQIAWPVFYHADLTVSEGLDVSDFTTFEHADGTLQTVYKGFPLYYYFEDKRSGDTKGENVGEVWYVAKPDYSLFYERTQLVGHNANSYIANYALTPYQVGEGETSYLTDAAGRTLYAFINDKNGINNFGGNVAVWPAFHADMSTLVVPSIFNREDFAEITKNGVAQITYKGWPLYYFGGNAGANPPVAGDVNPGDTRGISFPSPGTFPIANTLTIVAPN